MPFVQDSYPPPPPEVEDELSLYVVPFETSLHPSTNSNHSSRRFVAGATFFNYADLGSLRPTKQDATELLSARHFGLAVHVALCGFAYYFFSFGFGRLLGEYLRANNEQQVTAAKYVLVWPMALAVFIGLMSDALPIRGYRRKSYMAIGWCLSFFMFGVIIVLDSYGDSGRKFLLSPPFPSSSLFSSSSSSSSNSSSYSSGPSAAGSDVVAEAARTSRSLYPIAYLVVCLLAACGIQISWTAAIAVSIEYAQHEHLHHRGRIQGTLITLYFLGGLAAQILTACVISDGATSDHISSTISMGKAAVILASVCAIAIPCVLFCFDEEPFRYTVRLGSPAQLSLRQRLTHVWKFCHQNIVYRVVFFLGMHLLLLGLYNQNVREAVQQWSHVSRKCSLWVEVGRLAAQVLSTVIWKYYLRNLNWRKLALAGTLFYIATYVALTLATVHDVVRNEWVYGWLVSIADIPRAWLVIYTFILATEIAEIGHEGVTVALGISFQTLAALAGYTLSAMFPSLLGFAVTNAQIKEDSASTRHDVTKAFAIVVAFNLLSLPLVKLPPQQKLDAQQMRTFGGYNKFAGPALLVAFAVLLVVNLGVNLMVVL